MMRLTMHAGYVAGVLMLAGSATSFAQGAYVDQVDGGAARRTGVMPSTPVGPPPAVYLEQLPSTARMRPPPPPKRRLAARSGRKTANVAPQPPARTAPDVGAGVTLAVPPSRRDASVPSVGRGVAGPPSS